MVGIRMIRRLVFTRKPSSRNVRGATSRLDWLLIIAAQHYENREYLINYYAYYFKHYIREKYGRGWEISSRFGTVKRIEASLATC